MTTLTTSFQPETKTELKNKLIRLAQQVGNTPLLPIVGLHKNPNVKIFAKAEWQQLSGSVKARAAYSIVKDAIENGQLDETKILLDASSGNTGIAYATIGEILELPVTLAIPENATQKRKHFLKGLGAKIIYTSKFGGTDEAQEIAQNLAAKYPEKYFYASQYTNDNNWKAHYYGTAVEIFEELPSVDYFVAGLGTTGTFVGTSRKLKKLNPAIKTIALQPDVALHGLEGWKHLETAHVPQIYDSKVADSISEVTTEAAYRTLIELNNLHGLLLSPSAAANLAGAIALANKIESGTIVTILPDNADKYSEIISKII